MENALDKVLAITVSIKDNDDEMFSYQINELINLCEARGIEVVENVVQNLPHPNNKSYVGSGKLLEIKNLLDTLKVELVVVLDELSPVQLKNMENVLKCEIIDRTMLILEIFQLRAKTKEAILQVEIANMKYMLPRLVGSYTHLSRTGGSSSGSGGTNRGSGETKLELDRRHIERRIQKATEELQEVVINRQVSRKSRSANDIKTVAFVGYTNAGKSSTINTLLELFDKNTDKQVFVKNMLFATLETSTRSIKLPTNQEFLITDTVGFVSSLPHHLIESFKSTLEEITEADLIVHVVDASNAYAQVQIEATNKVLHDIGVKDIPLVYAFNKYDLVKNDIFLPNVDQDFIKLSNVTKLGFEQLIEYIKTNLFKDTVTTNFLIPYDKADIFTLFKNNSCVHSFSYENEGIKVFVTVSQYYYNLYNKYEKK